MEALLLAVVSPLISVVYENFLPLVTAAVAAKIVHSLGINDVAKRAETEQKLAAALKLSIGGGLSVALSPFRGLSEFDIKSQLEKRPEVLNTVLRYVERNNPDAVKAFKLDKVPGKAMELILAQLPDALARTAAVRTNAAGDAR